jgi:hypothetical protein
VKLVREASIWRHRRLVAQASAAIVSARSLRLALPAKRWEKLIGVKSPVTSDAYSHPTPPTGVDLDVSAAIAAASRRLPFTPTCLDQALAARWLLLRRGERPILVIGLNRADLSATSHAWLVGASGGTVTGAQPVAEFVAVTEFR